MEKYKIEIQEFLLKVVEIKAKSIEEAILKTKKKYNNSEIVLDYNDFVEVDFVDINGIDRVDEKNVLIKQIIEYFIEDEKKHFDEYDNKPENHIYNKLVLLKGLI